MIPDQENPEPTFAQDDAVSELPLEDARQLCALSRDLLFVLDSDGRFLHVNPAAFDILGWARETLYGRSFLDGVPESARARVAEQFARLHSEPQAIAFHAPYLTNSGSSIELHWIVSRSGLHLHGVGRRLDAGTADHADPQPAKGDAAGHAKTEFLASMNHELRTPLNAILGYTELLSSENALSPRQREALHAIKRSSEHLLLLINDILDFAKLDAGKLRLQPREFSVPKFFRTLTELFESRAREKRIKFEYQQVTPLPEVVSADETRLRQVLLNLCSNAIKFTSRGRVTLRALFAGGRLGVRVEDTGIGIQPSHLEAIFRPFEQIPHERGFVEGTGLGLSISRRLVELMGGTLRVDSEVGRGSTFWFEIEPEFIAPPFAESSALRSTTTQALATQASPGDSTAAGSADHTPAAGTPAAIAHGCTLEQLHAIRDAATIGDIRAILCILEDAGYRADDPTQAGSLAAELYRLAKAFRSKQIKERIQECIQVPSR